MSKQSSTQERLKHVRRIMDSTDNDKEDRLVSIAQDSDEKTSVRCNAIIVLRELGAIKASETLISIVRNPEEKTSVRRSAIVTLGDFHATEAHDDFVSILTTEHENQNLRESAIKALGKTGNEDTLRLLDNLRKAENVSRFGRQAAEKAYWYLKRRLEKTELFISYSRADWDKYVKPLVKFLRKEGFQVWVDQDLIEGGQDWLDAINEALKRCSTLILCVSPNALSSKYVKMEYRYFMDENKLVIPLICYETTLLAELRGLQYLHYKEFDKLINLLK